MKTYTPNQKIKGFIFVKEEEPFIRKNGYKRRRASFICPECKNIFITIIESIKSKSVRSCGCARYKYISKAKTTHGLHSKPIYQVYRNMLTRCYNKNNHRYKWYGARGISVCDQWKKDCISFFKWAFENGYKRGLELDRIDNDGNYEPSNCRFVTHKENMNNSREIISTNTSGYRGVSFHKQSKKWRAMHKKVSLGLHSTKEEANKAVQDYRKSLSENNQKAESQ